MRQLPHNLEAEQATIGSILIDPDVAHIAFPLVKSADFYDDKHRLIYQTMLEMNAQNMPTDLVTVSSKLRESGNLEKVGTMSYLVELMESTPSSLHIEYYANIVKQYSKLRVVVLAAKKVVNAAEGANNESVNSILDKSADMLYNALRDENSERLVTSEQMMVEYWDDLEKRYNSPTIAEISTGFEELDLVINGYAPSDLVIIAGRPSWGKTSFMMSSLLSLGKVSTPAVLFPYEMSKLQTSQRLVSQLSKVPLLKIKTAIGLSDQELQRMTKAVGEISKYPIYVDPHAFGDIYYLISAIRSYVARYGVKVVFIDYLQIIPTATDDLTNEFGKMTRMLKLLAVSLNITVVLVSQLNRNLEGRAEKRPRLSDLRQSGRIEEDADVVLFVYRDLEGDTPEIGELMVAKNRNGPAGGSLSLLFNPETTSFEGRYV